jgi:anti-sigma factor RsiW
MEITRDIIEDLLTVYLAGEASSDTRALIEDRLRTDPDLARRVEQARRSDLPAVPPPPPTSEKRALDRTRRYLRWRVILVSSAIYFSTLPLNVTFSSRGFEGLLLKSWPERVVALSLAMLLWALYWRMSRRMRVPGV